MTISPGRGLVFFMIGLPIGFIMSALGFVIMERTIAGPAIAPFALAIAVLVGLIATFWKPSE